jgi:hypothetical protein
MTSNAHLTQSDVTTTPASLRHPLHSTLPGAATYVVFAIWSGLVTAGIIAGVFAGDGVSRLALTSPPGSPPSRSCWPWATAA